MHRNILFGIIVVAMGFALTTVPTSALAASTGWVNAHELRKFSRRTLRGKTIPTSIACKNENNTKGMSRKNTIVKIGYRKTNKRVRWRWAWGTDVGRFKRKMAKQGFRVVSSGGFRRPSGLYIPCVLWHKNKGALAKG